VRAAIVASIVLTAVTAEAEPRRARLRATGACSLDAVAAQVADSGGSSIEDSAHAYFAVSSVRDAHGITARVVFVDDTGHEHPARELSAADCDELTDAVTVVVTVVLRERAPPRPTPPEPREPQQPQEQSTMRSTPPSITMIELGGASRITGELAAILGGRLGRASRSIGLELALEAPTHLTAGSGSVTVTTGRFIATPCVAARGFSACGVMAGGWSRGRSDGLMDTRTVTAPVFAVGVRAEWRASLTQRLGLRVFVELDQVLTTTRFLVDDMTVWTNARREAWVGTGAFLRFP
jgi:hypothetical protein